MTGFTYNTVHSIRPQSKCYKETTLYTVLLLLRSFNIAKFCQVFFIQNKTKSLYILA